MVDCIGDQGWGFAGKCRNSSHQWISVKHMWVHRLLLISLEWCQRFFFIISFLLFSSQNGMWRLPAVSLNCLPQNWHLIYPAASFMACSSSRCCLGSTGPLDLAATTARKARLSAFHLGIFSFFFCCSSFFSTAFPLFMSLTWSFSTIRWAIVLNSFRLLWNTFLQTFSCFSMLSGLNFLPQPAEHSTKSLGSYCDSSSGRFCSRFNSLIGFSLGSCCWGGW